MIDSDIEIVPYHCMSSIGKDADKLSWSESLRRNVMTKARFPLPELTARVDGWLVSITRQLW